MNSILIIFTKLSKHDEFIQRTSSNCCLNDLVGHPIIWPIFKNVSLFLWLSKMIRSKMHPNFWCSMIPECILTSLSLAEGFKTCILGSNVCELCVELQMITKIIVNVVHLFLRNSFCTPAYLIVYSVVIFNNIWPVLWATRRNISLLVSLSHQTSNWFSVGIF